MSATRDILFVTGTRADFGKLKPLMVRVDRHPQFRCHLFVTGMHLLAKYGSTVNEVQKVGFRSIHTYINQDSSTPSQMDIVLADTIRGLAHFVRERRPDMIVVHGDRVEALAGATVGALGNILVAHIEGGELSGTVDELIRHAVSKLAHLHFVANEEARDRLLRMGESPDSVFVIGSPDIDVMLSADLPGLDEVRRHYDIPFSGYGIVIYHPVTTELKGLAARAEALVEALLASGRNYVVIQPNNDHGSDIIERALERLEANPRFRLLPSMRFEAFLTLLRHAAVIVGNSSAGIREAPVYGIPTVNLGSRQSRRFQHGSIVTVPEETEAILAALRSLPASFPPSQYFGTGRSADAFMEALGLDALWQTSSQKQFRDGPE